MKTCGVQGLRAHRDEEIVSRTQQFDAIDLGAEVVDSPIEGYLHIKTKSETSSCVSFFDNVQPPWRRR